MNNNDRSVLNLVAAEMLQGDGFLSSDPDDNPRSTPKSILRRAEAQRKSLRRWAVEIARIAKTLPGL